MMMCVEYAAEKGGVHVLRWILESDEATGDTSGQSLWREQVCVWAAKGGQLETLKWFRNQSLHCGPYSLDYAACMRAAAEHSHLEVVRWLELIQQKEGEEGDSR
jgi:hypothetical protein